MGAVVVTDDRRKQSLKPAKAAVPHLNRDRSSHELRHCACPLMQARRHGSRATVRAHGLDRHRQDAV